MKFSAKENTFFLTSYKNTSHPSKGNLGNVTTTGTSMAAFKRLIKKTPLPRRRTNIPRYSHACAVPKFPSTVA